MADGITDWGKHAAQLHSMSKEEVAKHYQRHHGVLPAQRATKHNMIVAISHATVHHYNDEGNLKEEHKHLYPESMGGKIKSSQHSEEELGHVSASTAEEIVAANSFVPSSKPLPMQEQFAESDHSRSSILGHLSTHFKRVAYEKQGGAHAYWLEPTKGATIHEVHDMLKSKGVKAKKHDPIGSGTHTITGQHGKHGFEISPQGSGLHVRFHRTLSDKLGKDED